MNKEDLRKYCSEQDGEADAFPSFTFRGSVNGLCSSDIQRSCFSDEFITRIIF